ncbi:MAG: hypothetical protein H6733_04310 [Alphaproteobacteria bacterium]|nr:hypothetical protein [Alphaproteobacteria bacterium]
MSPYEVDPFDAPPLPAWAHGDAPVPVPQGSQAPARAFALDPFEDLDPEDAPTLPPRARRQLQRAVDRHAGAAADEVVVPRVVVPVVDPAPQDDWVLVAIGLGVACSMLTLLLMLFTGWSV